MTYNTAPRKPLSKKRRATFLLEHNSTCYFCGQPITDDKWDDEHILARELGGSDEMSNRAPIHRVPCHRIKTAQDRKLIAKSNRIRRAHGPKEQRRKPRVTIRSRGFSNQHHPLQSRSTFPKKPQR